MDKHIILEQKKYCPDESALYETLFHMCNGYVGIRNTIEFNSRCARPGIFIRDIQGYGISYTKKIINIPNWTDLSIMIGYEPINFDDVHIMMFDRQLDISNGIITLQIRFRDNNGRITRIKQKSILLQEPKNIYVSNLSIIAENYSDMVSLDYCVNYQHGNNYHGGFLGDNVKTHHWNLMEFIINQNEVSSWYCTNDSGTSLQICNRIESNQDCRTHSIRSYLRDGMRVTYMALQGVEAEFLQKVFFYAHIEKKIVSEYVNSSIDKFSAFTFQNFERYNHDLWQQKWLSFNIDIEGDSLLIDGLLYAQFELLQADNSDCFGSNIASRGLSSEYHGGHFFFNTDIYLVPYYSFFNPYLAKSLLYFRIKTLNTAIENAAKIGCKGAFWSEETGIDGEPAGPTWVCDYRKHTASNEKTGELVKHIGAMVVYSIKIYCDITDDSAFFTSEVYKLIAEVARYYISISDYNEDTGIYEINNNIGIDEYHIHVNNNFFTVEMARWVLRYSGKLFRENMEEAQKLKISLEELDLWNFVQERYYQAQVKDKVFEQYAGFFDLPPYCIDTFMENGLPVISEELREKINQFADLDMGVVKQCDVIMFLSMFRSNYTKEVLEANFRYYETCTLHESSLSATHAGLMSAFIGDADTARKYMKIAARFNMDFIPRENYNNGLHYASFAGSWLIILFGILGMDITQRALVMNPIPFPFFTKLGFGFNFRGVRLRINLNRNILTLSSVDGLKKPIKVIIKNTIYSLEAGREITAYLTNIR